MSQQLAGRTAVVTGASKGIGAEIARHLARAGANVVVNYASSKSGAEQTVAAIEKEGGKAIAVQADLSRPEQIDRLFDEAAKAFGALHILVNNAGIYEFQQLEDVTPEHFHKQFDLNVLGLLLASRSALRHFGPEGGAIINISSTVARLALPGVSVYSATKAAVNSITMSLAAELAPRKIRVNAVNPGMVDTEGAQAAGFIGSEFQRDVESKTPLGRIGQPQDISPAVVYLASDDSSWVTGEILYISGGFR